MYKKVEKWINEHNCLPKKNKTNTEEQCIAKWCTKQRTFHRKNKLDDIKIKQLEKLKCWYWLNDNKINNENDNESDNDDIDKNDNNIIINNIKLNLKEINDEIIDDN